MFNAPLPEAQLLKTVLKPLLDDFQHWFGRTQALLQAEVIDYMSAEEQANLLERIQATQRQVQGAQALLEATGGQVGLATTVLVPWHQLVLECWQVGLQFHHNRHADIPLPTALPQSIAGPDPLA